MEIGGGKGLYDEAARLFALGGTQAKEPIEVLAKLH